MATKPAQKIVANVLPGVLSYPMMSLSPGSTFCLTFWTPNLPGFHDQKDGPFLTAVSQIGNFWNDPIIINIPLNHLLVKINFWKSLITLWMILCWFSFIIINQYPSNPSSVALRETHQLGSPSRGHGRPPLRRSLPGGEIRFFETGSTGSTDSRRF